MEQESQMIQGTVLAVIYQNPENGYCVLKVRTEQGEAVTVVGTIPMSVVGERRQQAKFWRFCPPAPSRASGRKWQRKLLPVSAIRV